MGHAAEPTPFVLYDFSTMIVYNDPRKMKPTDKCLFCYNRDVSVKCTGKLTRFKPAREEGRLVTSEKRMEAIAVRILALMPLDFKLSWTTAASIAIPSEGKVMACND